MFNNSRAFGKGLPRRDCAKCSRNYGMMQGISFQQWQLGPGISLCVECSNPESVTACAITRTARCNKATAAEYDNHDLDNPFAKGSFRWVAKGIYVEGDRKGQPCVCKWFKKRGSMENDCLTSELDTANEAISLIALWNKEKFIDREIRVNSPEIWTFDNNDGGSGWGGVRVLQEPFIVNYEKFNSNNGWNTSSFSWARVMQAVSHFSYHVSNGQSLLCDLQGAVYRNGVILTDPAINSKAGKFGPADLGEKGISSFFARHVCNEFCRSLWRRPTCQQVFHIERRGSTMEVSSRASRPEMSEEPSRKRRRIGDEGDGDDTAWRPSSDSYSK